MERKSCRPSCAFREQYPDVELTLTEAMTAGPASV
jgi:hypothetical protein